MFNVNKAGAIFRLIYLIKFGIFVQNVEDITKTPKKISKK